MKKLIFTAMLTAAAFCSCQKMPSVIDADGEFMVTTSYDRDADFGSYATFTVADTLLVLDQRFRCDSVKNSFSDQLVAEFKEMMESCGYTYVPVDERENADLGIQLSYVSETSYYVDYVDPYWWLDYPGYWSSAYWGSWGGGWYYPYPVAYQSSTHTLMADMADLTSADGEDQQLRMVWSCLIDGNAGGTRTDLARFKVAIRQAFAQSPYIDAVSE